MFVLTTTKLEEEVFWGLTSDFLIFFFFLNFVKFQAETAAAQVIHVDERRESIFIPESDLEGSDFENTPHRSQIDAAKEPLKK